MKRSLEDRVMKRSLEDRVRRDIERWLRDLDELIELGSDEEATRLYEAEQLLYVKGAAAYNRFLNREAGRKPGSIERAFTFYTSIDFARQTAQQVREKLAAGDMAGAYAQWRVFDHIGRILRQNNIRLGKSIARAAMAGHEAAHGTSAEKRARWQHIYDDYEAEKAKGTAKAAEVVAGRHGVSVKTVRRAKGYLLKID